jgi:hypothetical protein
VNLGFGPDERLGGFVIVLDEGVDVGFEFVDGLERCAVKGLAGENRKPDFDLVQPGGVGWRVVEAHVLVTGQPQNGHVRPNRALLLSPFFQRDASKSAEMASRPHPKSNNMLIIIVSRETDASNHYVIWRMRDDLFDLLHFVVFLNRWDGTLLAGLLAHRQDQISYDGIGWANRSPPRRRTRYLHDLKNGVTLGTDDRHAIEIEKGRVAVQASALYAEFGFGHCN